MIAKVDGQLRYGPYRETEAEAADDMAKAGLFQWLGLNSLCFTYIHIDSSQFLVFYIYSYKLVSILCVLRIFL